MNRVLAGAFLILCACKPSQDSASVESALPANFREAQTSFGSASLPDDGAISPSTSLETPDHFFSECTMVYPDGNTLSFGSLPLYGLNGSTLTTTAPVRAVVHTNDNNEFYSCKVNESAKAWECTEDANQGAGVQVFVRQKASKFIMQHVNRDNACTHGAGCSELAPKLKVEGYVTCTYRNQL